MAIFKNYFFHNLTQKYILAFGDLFTNIQVQKLGEDNKPQSMITVPCTYSNKEKWAQRMLDDPDHTRQDALTLPRIAYTMTDMSYDSNRKLARNTTMKYAHDVSESIRAHPFSYTPVPYQLSFTVDVVTKTQNELYQILEQIIPAFVPDIVIRVKSISENVDFDMPVSFGGVFYSDTYDGQFEQRRQITATLNFTVKTYYFAPVNSRNIILDVKVPVYEMDVNEDLKKSVLDGPIHIHHYEAKDYPELQRIKQRG